jgi:hypothetical protein
MKKENGRRIGSLVFLASTLVSVSVLRNLDIGSLLSISSAIFTGIITAGIWLEVSYRFLIKEATAPLDRLIEKL